MLPLLLLLLPPPATPAGMTTHNIIARLSTLYEGRFSPLATDGFDGLLHDRIDAMQGGAPFPDYLYACGDDHDAGEEAHWEVSVLFLRSTTISFPALLTLCPHLAVSGCCC